MTGMYTNEGLNVVLECISSAYLPHRSKGSTWTTRLLLETKEITCMLQPDTIHVGVTNYPVNHQLWLIKSKPLLISAVPEILGKRNFPLQTLLFD